MSKILKSSRERVRKASLFLGSAAVITLAAGGAHAQALQTMPALPSPPASPGRVFTLTPSLGAEESFTDNADFTSTNRQSDNITRILAGLDGTLDATRVRGTFQAQVAYDFYGKASNLDGWSYKGNLNGQLDIVKNKLTIDANAQLTTGNISTLGETAIDRSGTQGRIQVGIYTIGPHLTTQLGSVADLDAGVRISEVTYQPGDGSTVLLTPQDSTIGNAYFKVDTTTRYTGYQLVLSGQYTEDDRNFKLYSVLGSGYLRVAPNVRLVGRVGYDSVKQPAVVDIQAGRWMLGTEVALNERSTITVEGGQRYDRPAYAADAYIVVSDQFYLTANYHEEIQPAQLSLEDSFLGFVAQTQLPVTPLTVNTFTINGNLFGDTTMAKSAELSAVYTWPQQRISLTTFWNDQLLLSTNTRDRTLTTSVDYLRNLRPDLSAELSFDYSKTRQSPLNTDSETYGASIRAIYSLRPTTLLTVGYAYQDNKELFAGGQRFYENAVFVSLMKTF